MNEEAARESLDMLSLAVSHGNKEDKLHPINLAFTNCDTYSSQFLHTRPDSIGNLSDLQFRVSIATYLGSPCPLYSCCKGQYVGHKERVSVVDEHGHSACAHSTLPGAHHLEVHKTVQRQLASIAKFCKLRWAMEPANTFMGLVQMMSSRTTQTIALNARATGTVETAAFLMC